jgi:hypothetical protein
MGEMLIVDWESVSEKHTVIRVFVSKDQLPPSWPSPVNGGRCRTEVRRIGVSGFAGLGY